MEATVRILNQSELGEGDQRRYPEVDGRYRHLPG